MAGRPTKITPAARQAVAEGLARGQVLREIALSVGVAERTVSAWLARANKAEHVKRSTGKLAAAERPFLELHEAIAEAEQGADLRALREIAQYLTVGVDLFTAASAAGVPPKMLDRLHNTALQIANRRDAGDRLDEEEREYLTLHDGYAQAFAATEVKALGTIQKAMLIGDWKAAAWWLERRQPEKYARPVGQAKPAGGRPIGATSAPDRPSTADEPPPRLRLAEVRTS